MMKRYTVTIDIIDNDYNSWVGYKFIHVDSWDEAVEWCNKEDWSGHSHMIEDMKGNKTGKRLKTRKEYIEHKDMMGDHL